jgi:hypothetical protein
MPPELSDVLVDVWSQVLLHDSSVVKLGAERFLVSMVRRGAFEKWNSPLNEERSSEFSKTPTRNQTERRRRVKE